MLQAITIERFRGISRLEAKGFRDVNLILGRNNSGKTSFLEAVWLLCSGADPGVWLDMTALRSYRPLPDLLRQNAQVLGPLWCCCFRQMDLSKHIEFTSIYVRSGKPVERFLRIAAIASTDPCSESNCNPPSQGSRPLDFISRVIFQRKEQGDLSAGEIWFENGLLRMRHEVDVEIDSLSSSIIPTCYPSFELSRVLQHAGERIYAKRKQLLATVRSFEPAVRDVQLRLEGGKWEVYFDMGFSAPLPLSALGQGMFHLFSIATSLHNLSFPGVLLVDQIGTGIHHTEMEKFWRTVATLAVQRRIQIFATTHNKEVLFSAIRWYQKYKRDHLGVFRIDRSPEGFKFVEYDAELLDYIVQRDIEIRG